MFSAYLKTVFDYYSCFRRSSVLASWHSYTVVVLLDLFVQYCCYFSLMLASCLITCIKRTQLHAVSSKSMTNLTHDTDSTQQTDIPLHTIFRASTTDDLFNGFIMHSWRALQDWKPRWSEMAGERQQSEFTAPCLGRGGRYMFPGTKFTPKCKLSFPSPQTSAEIATVSAIFANGPNRKWWSSLPSLPVASESFQWSEEINGFTVN